MNYIIQYELYQIIFLDTKGGGSKLLIFLKNKSKNELYKSRQII